MFFLLLITGLLAADPCQVNNGGCDQRTDCTIVGAYVVCGVCPKGFESALGDAPCQDLNECLHLNGGCDTLTECKNTIGSRSCGKCPEGYTGTGETGCIDQNECLINNGGCSNLTTCYNTRGSRVCGVCPPGYEGTGENGCSDVDECESDNGGCDDRVICINTPGSRECGHCPDGFLGNGLEGCYEDKDNDGIPDPENGTETETYSHLIERISTQTARIKTEHLMAQEASQREYLRQKEIKEKKLQLIQALLDRVEKLEKLQTIKSQELQAVPDVKITDEENDNDKKNPFDLENDDKNKQNDNVEINIDKKNNGSSNGPPPEMIVDLANNNVDKDKDNQKKQSLLVTTTTEDNINMENNNQTESKNNDQFLLSSVEQPSRLAVLDAIPVTSTISESDSDNKFHLNKLSLSKPSIDLSSQNKIEISKGEIVHQQSTQKSKISGRISPVIDTSLQEKLKKEEDKFQLDNPNDLMEELGNIDRRILHPNLHDDQTIVNPIIKPMEKFNESPKLKRKYRSLEPMED